MWNWLQENSAAVSAVAATLTLVVWAFYFQLLLSSYQHGRRAKILINRGAGYRMDAKCVITNMSAQTIYIEAILLTLNTKDRETVCWLSNLNVSLSTDGDRRAQWFQGPLATGEFIEIGSFDDIIDRATSVPDDAEDSALPSAAIHSISIMVVGTYTAEDGIVAAKREFDVKKIDGERVLRPRTFTAIQIRSRRQRRAIERYILEKHTMGDERKKPDQP